MIVERLKAELLDLKKQKPEEPTRLQFLYEDVTPESIAYELYKGSGNAALSSDEGATILSGRVVQNIPMLNKFWSGESFSVSRKSSPGFVVDDPRLTISIMSQPSAMTKFMKKKGDESLGVGFLARFLVCNPLSNQGNRYMKKGWV